MLPGKKEQWGTDRVSLVLSTLGGQHGTCCLLEVQKLLQEEDGLVGGTQSRRKVRGKALLPSEKGD